MSAATTNTAERKWLSLHREETHDDHEVVEESCQEQPEGVVKVDEYFWSGRTMAMRRSARIAA